jgi:phage FluMu protein gp41
MATLTITLTDGIKLGADILTEAVLRSPTAGDVMDAQEESEKLVETIDGPRLVSSPTLSGAGMLRRQIVRIGNLDGPLSRADLAKLTPRDLLALQMAADKLDDALAGEALADRGRDSGVGK